MIENLHTYIDTVTAFSFWLALILLGYTYIGYPALLALISKFFTRDRVASDIEPSVSIIITARNEELHIQRKLQNTIDIDYPRNKFEVLVVSDFSDDGTDSIVGQFTDKGVRLIRPDRRLGKTAAQNLAVENAVGEILVFTDATTEYPKGILRTLLPRFADPDVGCVAGRLRYVDESGSSIGRNSSGYWDYETLIKQKESDICSLIGVSGCLYAVRRNAYVPMYAEACSDFLIASVMYKQGLVTVFEPDAVCSEATNIEGRKEFNMRVRIIAQTLSDLWRNRTTLNPFRTGFFAIQLISHKILRYMVPFLLLTLFLTSLELALNSTLYLVVFVFQVIFWLVALAGLELERRKIACNLVSYPAYFALLNAATVMGLYKFLNGETFSQWEPSRT